MKRVCVNCEDHNAMQAFSGETHTVEFRGASAVVEKLSGFRCLACGEVEFDEESAERYAEAGDALVRAARAEAGSELRRIRRKLGLNQVEASRLTGGGHNAFSRYETGKVTPTPAVINLFRLLDRHPEEVDRLKRA
ncbi:type II toxin-antitoxin system MqsA family antitoxin [Affinirhizobium pseudoryzae]|uniref:type II toxin-antitoxin system MqsA family antitoxin n=1 Tax=Allorhizobium pseudoryzae TaxID=379684 RepID=UPI0013EBFD89|nr:type II toxin-antitoxin system MqsA family antitoxin [Allorhizobium pseudoryzae]